MEISRIRALKAGYVALRQESIQHMARDVEQAEEEVAELHKQLKGYLLTKLAIRNSSSKLKQLRNEYAEAQLRLGRLRKIAQDLRSSEDSRSEFETLLHLHGVYEAAIFDSRLFLMVCAQIEFNHKRYDNGDWLVELDMYRRIFDATIVREINTRPSKTFFGIPYRIGCNRFCFGASEAIIDDLIQAGDFVAGLSLAVGCLHAVNEDDREYIPQVFYEWSEHEH